MDGPRLKIARAREHLGSFRAEVDVYLRNRPYELTADQNPDGTWSHRFSVTTAPPLRLSAIIGDVVTNARAALDHIAWQLALRYFDPPLRESSAERRKAEFPLSDEAYERSKGHFKARKVPQAVIDEIQRTRGSAALGHLNDLVNKDKHRTLLLTVGVLGERAIFEFERITRIGGYKSATLLEGSTLVSRERYENDNVRTHVYVHWLPQPHGSIGSVDAALEVIVSSVAAVVQRIDPLLA